MNQLPFSVYDFFGYLASGAVLLASFVAAFFGEDAFENSPTLVLGFLLVIVIYALGQTVANLAGELIEHRIVRRRLGTPTDILLCFRHPEPSVSRWFPGYFRPLSPGVREQVKERAGDRHGDDLFFHCHARMKLVPVVQSRLETFIRLYGFCRNTALAMVIASVFLGVGIILGTAGTGSVAGPGWWLVLAVIASVGLFYRYLKFYRQYGFELFTSYAEAEFQ
ncbi:MAG: hypothetical protein WB507_11310 [Solirubrobacterales bacterium]